MLPLSRLKNRIIAKVTTRSPSLARGLTEAFSPLETEGVPWTALRKPLSQCKLAVVTTAGVHHRGQLPFDMNDRKGDPTFRVIDVSRPISSLMITHDYYDHSDADRDINIVFPIERLWELESEGIIGEVARFHYGLMGHVKNQNVQVLVKESAPEVAQRLKSDDVDAVLLTPG
jgi:D-proline reductase (dithiol) PrdB